MYVLTKSVWLSGLEQHRVHKHQLDELLHDAVSSALHWESVVKLSGKCFIFGRFPLRIRVLFSATLPAKHMAGPRLWPNAIQLPVVSCAVLRG